MLNSAKVAVYGKASQPVAEPSTTRKIGTVPGPPKKIAAFIGASTCIDYPYFPFSIPVDYVLVHRTDDLSKQYHRTLFEKACRSEGLVVNHSYSGPICFTLISTPFHRLCREAEKTQISFPLKDCPINPTSPTCCVTLSKIFVTDDTVKYISCPFQRKFSHLFLNFHNEKIFFSTCQRDFLTNQILAQIDISFHMETVTAECTETNEKNAAKTPIVIDSALQRKGLEYLLMEESYEDGFILHDPSEVEPYFRQMRERSISTFIDMMTDIEDDPRQELDNKWCRWYKTQPMNAIREYFGEQIAFYFAWQGTCITLLWPAAIVGVAVFAFGMINSINTSPVSFTNCTQSHVDKFGKCPLTDSASLFFSTLSTWFINAFDNVLNPFYAVFMSIWGSLFFQIWRRNNSVLSYEWDTDDLHEVEPDRPQYRGTRLREDPITGEAEWLTPQLARFCKMFLSSLVVLFFMFLVLISVICVSLYKLWVIDKNDCRTELTLECSMLSSYLPSFLNTISTMLLGWIYGNIVEKLNDWENHRTNTDYSKSLIIKLFAFQIVNNYTSLFYVAFIRPEGNGFQSNGLFGLGSAYKDICVEGTCGSLLALQLLSHVIIKPIPKFTKDIILPFIYKMYRISKWRNRNEQSLEEIMKESDETDVLVREWLKPSPGDFTLWEFNEKIVLFGTTMMFAALFPLAPLITMIIGVADLRIDAHRLLWFNRRPLPVPASGIGIWLPIQEFLTYAAVITNAFIIAFTSDFCVTFFDSKYCDIKNRLVMVIFFQNAVFCLKYVIQSVIPTVPASIKVAQRRRRYILSHIVEKGDVPYKLKIKIRTRKAKLAWITSRARGKENSLDKNVQPPQLPTA